MSPAEDANHGQDTNRDNLPRRARPLSRTAVVRWVLLAAAVYLALRAAFSPTMAIRAVWTVGALALIPALWTNHRWDLTGVRIRPWWAGTVAAVLALGWLRGGQVGSVRLDSISVVVSGLVVIASLPTILAARRTAMVTVPAAVPVCFPFGPSFGGYVVQGGASKLLNHHQPHPEQCWAVDLIPVSGQLIRNAATGAAPVEVVAPLGGTVVAAVDGYPDRSPAHLAVPPHGNLVIIEEVSAGVVTRVALSHLAERSIVVTEGQRVAAGDPIGQVGNSGRSTEPHLHIHAVRLSDDAAVGVPLMMGTRSPWRGRLFAGAAFAGYPGR